MYIKGSKLIAKMKKTSAIVTLPSSHYASTDKLTPKMKLIVIYCITIKQYSLVSSNLLCIDSVWGTTFVMYIKYTVCTKLNAKTSQKPCS